MARLVFARAGIGTPCQSIKIPVFGSLREFNAAFLQLFNKLSSRGAAAERGLGFPDGVDERPSRGSSLFPRPRSRLEAAQESSAMKHHVVGVLDQREIGWVVVRVIPVNMVNVESIPQGAS